MRAPSLSPTATTSVSPSVTVTPSVSVTSTNSVSPSPSNEPVPVPLEGVDAYCSGDPHCRTWDGLRFDCQARGEVVLARSVTHKIEIQARFGSPRTTVTTTKAVAIKVGETPVVQISVPENVNTLSDEVGGCDVAMFVGGNPVSISSWPGSAEISVNVVGVRKIEVVSSTGVKLEVFTRSTQAHGCILTPLRIFLPGSVLVAGDFIGLLGTPNGNAEDDWHRKNGEVIAFPQTEIERRTEAATNYCSAEWCIKDESDSIFSYEDGTDFQFFEMCSTGYSKVDMTAVPADVKALCGADEACLLDGTVGGVEDAQAELEAQAEDAARVVVGRPLVIRPSVIEERKRQEVVVTMDVRNVPASARQGLQSFRMFQINQSGKIIRQYGTLKDNGMLRNGDFEMGDLVFSFKFTLPAQPAGATFSGKVVPIINGAIVEDSPLVMMAFDALQVFSAQSGIVR